MGNQGSTATSETVGPFAIELLVNGPLYWAAALHGACPLASINIRNDGTTPLQDILIEVSSDPSYLNPEIVGIANLNAKASVDIASLALKPNFARLKELIEAEHITLTARLMHHGAELAASNACLEVLAHNAMDWSVRQDLLGAFIMPNHPAITELVATARCLQQREFGAESFEGTQAGNVKRIQQQAAAVYGALQRVGITYLTGALHWKDGGQKLRPPEALRREKQGNCIDVATWYAAALEACGLRPVMVLMQEHAFSGVWLDEDPWSQGPVLTDAATVRKLHATGALLLIETTSATHRPPVPFDQACAAGIAKITDSDFRSLLDVAGLRRQGIKPLNVAAEQAAATTDGVPVVAPDLSLPNARAQPQGISAKNPHDTTRFGRWISTLMDQSLRNPLINSPMQADADAFGGLRPKRDLLLAVTNLGTFENELADGTVFTLRTDLPKAPDPLDIPATSLFRDDLEKLQTRKILAADPGGAAVKDRAHKLWKRHQAMLEEKGTSSLHVSIGCLRWYEEEAPTMPRYAPLLLAPVNIERQSVGGDFKLSLGDGETLLNAALVQKLKRDFDLDLSGLAANLPEDDYGVDPEAVLVEITGAVLKLRRFEVLHCVTLGFFDYRKQFMAHDLKAMEASSVEAPNSFIAAMVPGLRAPTQSSASITPNGASSAASARTAHDGPAAPLTLVVDADSSQHAAVTAALNGESFVLQGPPGTGKSQTITNIIAALLSVGRRVLFVAEKRAALSVVAKRLARVGLESACLELHSEKADPSTVSNSLVQALEADRPRNSNRFETMSKDVDTKRHTLDSYVQRLHAPTPLGLSFYEAAGRRHALRDHPRCAMQHANILDTTEAQLAARLQALDHLEIALTECNGWTGHPLAAVRLSTWTERRSEQADAALRELSNAAQAAVASLLRASGALGLEATTAAAHPDTLVAMLELLAQAPPTWVRELTALSGRDEHLRALHELCAVATRRSQRLAQLSARWTEGLEELDLVGISTAIRTAEPRFFVTRWFAMRKPKEVLRGVSRGPLAAVPELLADLELATAAHSDAKTLDNAAQAVAQLMGPAYAGSHTAASTFGRAQSAKRWMELASTLARHAREGQAPEPQTRAAIPEMDAVHAKDLATELSRALERARGAADRTTDLLALERTQAFGAQDATMCLEQAKCFAQTALANIGRLRDKTASEAAAAKVESLGLAEFIKAVREGVVPESGLPNTYAAGFFKAWVDEMTEAHSGLANFRGREHDRHVDVFRKADRALLEAGQEHARHAVAERRPVTSGATPALSEMGILRRESMKKRNRLPVRALLAKLPTLLPRLKPCFLMSPLTVAHFLPVDIEKFDTVIFDEASQVTTPDAIGALWRGRQVLVVGDSQQMPPTDFFTVGMEEPDEAEAEFVPADTESILDEAVASGVTSRRLLWHYRSRDERLIAFSNRHYYDGALLTFPAADPEADGSGVFNERVQGIFDRGASRRNEVEACRVAEIVVQRLRDPVLRERSIGVVTFNVAQQELIERLLEDKQREFPEIERYFGASAPEPVFVKNLESVQGDERDVMVFSTTYGTDKTGKFLLNFGPMNKTGGERRLNVAITRARERLIVITSMDPEKIDLARTNAVGVKHFRDFLRYARDGVRALPDQKQAAENAHAHTPIEADVHAMCTALGFVIDQKLGCSGYRIDLAVRDPEKSGRHVLAIECDGASYNAAATARDRDRLRQEVLSNLGWNMHRIWSTDWRVSRDAEIQRLRSVCQAAIANPRRPVGAGANAQMLALPDTATPAQATPSVSTSAAMPNLPPSSTSSRLSGQTLSAQLRAELPVDPDEVTDAQRRTAILAVLATGGAMPKETLFKAAATQVGLLRMGTRIRAAFEIVHAHLLRTNEIRLLGDLTAPVV